MSQLYVRVMTGFYTHRKTARLRVRIGDDAFWVPPRLWAYAAENQPDGDLSNYTSEDLAMLLGCNKHASSMLQALKDSGFVDPDGKIHDWHEHNGYHQRFSERGKTAAKTRWAKEKSPTPPKEEIQTVDSGNRTVETSIAQASPKHARSMQDASVADAPVSSRFQKPSMVELEFEAGKLGLPKEEAEKFFNYYESNGWRVGKVPMKDWRAALRNWNKNYRERTGGFMPKKPEQRQLSELIEVKSL